MITAYVTSLTNTDTWAKAGVMIRDARTPGSRHALTAVTPESGLAKQRRLTAGGFSSHTAGPYKSAPYWVRIERRGDLVISSVALDDSTWSEIRRETIRPERCHLRRFGGDQSQQRAALHSYFYQCPGGRGCGRSALRRH